MITYKKLKEFKEYLESGDFIKDLEMRPPDGQAEMLDLIELLFETCEVADQVLTKHFYRKWGNIAFGKEPKTDESKKEN